MGKQYKPNFVASDREDWGKGPFPCNNCGKQVDPNDSPDSFLCQECYEELKEAHNNLVAGVWRVNNKDVRKELAKAIEDNTPYSVAIIERVGDVLVYSPNSN